MSKKTTTPDETEATTDVAPKLQFIHLDMIEALPQVRKTFDEATLYELAESIKTMGMLQPVLLRENTHGIKYTIIAGERRVRAARLAGLESVPALVGKADDERVRLMQLVENIQREELNLAETAQAIKDLFAVHKSQKKLCEVLGKSPAWVSKHMAFAHGLTYTAQRLMEQGIDDLELLLIVSNLSALDYKQANSLATQIIDGKAGRKEARDLVKKVRADKEKSAQAAKKAQKEREQQVRQMTLDVPPKQDFRPILGIELLSSLAGEKVFDLRDAVDRYDQEQQQSMIHELTPIYEKGRAHQNETPLVKMRAMNWFIDGQHRYELQTAVFILGLNGQELTLDMAVTECRSMYQFCWEE